MLPYAMELIGWQCTETSINRLIMSVCTNPLRVSDGEKPAQIKQVGLRGSQPLAFQGLGASHSDESSNVGETE